MYTLGAALRKPTIKKLGEHLAPEALRKCPGVAGRTCRDPLYSGHQVELGEGLAEEAAQRIAGALSALWQAETEARSASEISDAETLRHLKTPTGRFRRAREVGLGMRSWSADASTRRIY
jgi:hypothetical protein